MRIGALAMCGHRMRYGDWVTGSMGVGHFVRTGGTGSVWACDTL